jgi:hypothetical protein
VVFLFYQKQKKQKYHTVGTDPKTKKTKITTLSGQFQNLKKQKYHTVGTVPKYRKTKIPHCRDSSKI